MCETNVSTLHPSNMKMYCRSLVITVLISYCLYQLWPFQGSFCECTQPMRRCYIVTSSLIGWAHTQNDPCHLWTRPLLNQHKNVYQNTYISLAENYACHVWPCLFRIQCINSLWPSDAIWHHTFWSILLQVIVWRLTGTKSLPKPMLTYWQIGHQGTNFCTCWIKPQ